MITLPDNQQVFIGDVIDVRDSQAKSYYSGKVLKFVEVSKL